MTLKSSTKLAKKWDFIFKNSIHATKQVIRPLGKLLSGVIAFIGIGLVALPTGIISSGFIEEMRNNKKKNKYCPNFGEKIEQGEDKK